MRPLFRTSSSAEERHFLQQNLTSWLNVINSLAEKPEFIELEMNHLSKNVARLFEYWKQRSAQRQMENWKSTMKNTL